MSNAPDRSGADQPHRADHFNEAAMLVRGHNGMNEDPEIPRFGADEYDG